MSFSRNLVQLFIESKAGCTDITKWKSYRSNVESLSFSSSDVVELEEFKKDDASSYFVKGITSLFYALSGINLKKYSWAIVKLYYSLFYFIRCEILLSNYILVRCNSLYYAPIRLNQKLIKFIPSDARGDHQISIRFINYLHNENIINDPFQANLLDDKLIYEWFLLQREKINYIQKDFNDPQPIDLIENYLRYYSNGTHNDLLAKYYYDTEYLYCYDLQNTLIATPLSKARFLKEKLIQSLPTFSIDSDLKQHLISVSKINSSSILMKLL